jgi:hypothetical protein
VRGVVRQDQSGFRASWNSSRNQWQFTLYDKNELSDLSKKDLATLENLLKIELKMRNRYEEKAQFDG